MTEVNAIAVIAYRDLLKFLRDVPRIVSSLVFPLLFIGVLGGSLQSNFGSGSGYDFLTFIFTGVFAQTLFQSTAMGVISLIDDRENDFSQEIFVSPISRYSIVFGKILGESLVALPQGVAIVAFGLLVGVHLGGPQLVALLGVGLATCFFGGAFGIVMLSSFNSRRAANEIFPFILFPQIFTAGIFTPIRVLPLYLEILSRISPLRYAVDLLRNLFYARQPESARVTLDSAALDAILMAFMFAGFLILGTALFVRNERNR